MHVWQPRFKPQLCFPWEPKRSNWGGLPPLPRGGICVLPYLWECHVWLSHLLLHFACKNLSNPIITKSFSIMSGVICSAAAPVGIISFTLAELVPCCRTTCLHLPLILSLERRHLFPFLIISKLSLSYPLYTPVISAIHAVGLYIWNVFGQYAKLKEFSDILGNGFYFKNWIRRYISI